MKRTALAFAALAALAVSGCSRYWDDRYASNLEKWSSRKCVKDGYARGTPLHIQCSKFYADQEIAQNHAATEQSRQLMGLAIGVGLAANAIAPTYVAPASPPPAQRETSSARYCLNGRYVYGSRCYLAPDGSYVGAPPKPSPYGGYVGGAGRLILCPDGARVAGSSCRLMPDGHYVGVPE